MAKVMGSPSVQDTFADSYRIIRSLDADDPRSTLFLAEQTSTDRPCALRILDARLVASAEGKKRFDELRVLRNRIHTDHVVDLQAAGIDKTTGSPWFALAWLEGKTLAEHAGEPLEDDDSQEILTQVARGLGAVHGAGLTFGDLRPESVRVAESQRPNDPLKITLLDFWTYAWLQESRPGAEGPDRERLFWLAPEQVRGDAGVGPAADIWAFGLLAFRLITGLVFWRSAEGPENADVLKEVTRDPIPRASVRADELGMEPGLSAEFDRWFARCVTRAVADRFESIDAALDALIPILEQEEGEDEEEDEAEEVPAKAPVVVAQKPRLGKAKAAKAATPAARIAAALPPWLRNSDFAIPGALLAAILVAFGIRASTRPTPARTADGATPIGVLPATPQTEAPRPIALTESGAQAIEATLSASERGSPVWISVAAVDASAEAMGRRLNAIFERAGWRTHPLQHSQTRARPGIFIFAESEPPSYLETVQRALVAGGLRPSVASGYRAYLTEMRRQQPDFQGFDLEPGQTYVIVLGRGE